MKLSEIRGERALEVVADLIDPIAKMSESESARELFQKIPAPEGEDPVKFSKKRLLKGIPALLRENKTEIITVLAAINGKTPEEYAKVFGLTSLVKDALDLVNDESFIDLFFSAQTETASGSAPENTEAPEQ